MKRLTECLHQLDTYCEERDLVGKLTFLLTMCVVVVTVFSPLNFSMGAEFLLFSLVLILINFRKNRELWLVLPSLLICGGVLMLLLLSGKWGERGFNAPVAHALKFVNILLVHVLAVLTQKMNEKRKKIVVVVFFGGLLVSILISLYYIMCVDMYAVRDSATRGFPMVLNFEQVYMLPFAITTIACALAATIRKIKPALWYLPFLVLSLVCLCMSLLTTAILLTVLGCGVSAMFALFYRRPKWFWITVGVLVVFVMICILFRQQVSDLLYAMTEKMHWLVQSRIRAVIDIIFGTSHDNWYQPSRRDELAGYSLSSFYSNPIFGIGYVGYGYGTIGAHQEWYDMLGVFGIVGTLLFVLMMANMTVQVFRNSCTVIDKACLIIGVFMLIVLGFLNPCLSVPTLFTIYVVAPNVSMIIGYEAKTKRK